MKIGLDLSVIQTPHRMRGIGATAINFVKHLPEKAKKKHDFVLFMYDEKQSEALGILDLEGIDYEIRSLEKQERINLALPGKLKKLNGPLNSIRALINRHKGDLRIQPKDLADLDAYVQFDQMQAPPKRKALRTMVILYDLIPYILESDYLWNFRTARKRGDSRKSSLRKALLRHQYISEVKAVCKQATYLAAISNHTKKDFVKCAGTPAKKIQVVHLGIEARKASAIQNDIKMQHYVENSWGYIKKPIDLTEKPFILFVGGADPRRKLIDLVAAYNNLKAQRHDIRLVLAGDTMKGAKSIPVVEVQKYVRDSSYLEDIIFLGFVADEEREWLYQKALAFVFPSVYEGFGLPILEAMAYGCPVICYDNPAVREVGGNIPLYAQNAEDIKNFVIELLGSPNKTEILRASGIEQAKKFSWSHTSAEILYAITK